MVARAVRVPRVLRHRPPSRAHPAALTGPRCCRERRPGDTGGQECQRDEESEVPQGTVRWFDADRGFGFIDLGNEAEDLFVHASEIVGEDGPKQLREGQ
ncbi:MAG TPA: cold shock domain-containing protein, partial [Isoptericola sp.]|nr:cold shock domain-containing protein [Isoptericola sp.]